MLVILLQVVGFFIHIASVNVINFIKFKELLFSCTTSINRKILDFPAILISTPFTETLKISISIETLKISISIKI